jgi:hypothetical protein
MKKTAIILALALIFCLGFTLSAQAIPTLEFIIDDHAAGIVYMDPDGQGVRGENITVTEVVGIDTPLNSGVHLTLTQGLLFFHTGDFTGIVDGSKYLYSAGRYIQVTGAVVGTAITDLSTLLLTGVFTGIPEVDVVSGGGIVKGSFTDQKNDILASFYGLAGNAFTSGNLNLSFASLEPLNPPESFRSTAGVGGGLASNEVNAIPLPPSGLLLGSGVLGLVISRFRRK